MYQTPGIEGGGTKSSRPVQRHGNHAVPAGEILRVQPACIRKAVQSSSRSSDIMGRRLASRARRFNSILQGRRFAVTRQGGVENRLTFGLVFG
jgi:hypothetical protein